jgi:uncharacterized membrane protein YbhN (UPF0104 family)
LRVIQWLGGLAVVLFVARSVAASWDEVRSADLDWDLHWLRLLGAVLITWTVFVLQSEAWRRMVAAWGYPLRWWPAARIWLLSSMARYVPGKVWALAGMALMAQRRGVPAWVATGSSLLLQVLALGTGALVASLAGAAVLDAAGLGRASLVVIAAASITIIALAISPKVTPRLIRRFVPGAATAAVSPPSLRVVGFGVAVNALAWIGFSLAFLLFTSGFLPEVGLTLPEAIGASTAAHVAGNLAPFAPAGLGVRESVLVLVLRDRTGLAQALALAAVARLGATVAEIGATIPFLVRPDEAKR